jgi:putative ABC transport system substrate-binding protein
VKPLVFGLVIWLGAVASSFAQDKAGMPVVGVMRVNTASNNEPFATLFREGLAARGYVEGGNLRLDYRFADGDRQRFPEMAEALVKEKVSVIVVFSDPAARAAQRASDTIPIIAVVSDFIASGLGASLAKPGGKVTGVSMLEPELEAKRLEILKEILPGARRLGLLNDSSARQPGQLQVIEDAAQALGVSTSDCRRA